MPHRNASRSYQNQTLYPVNRASFIKRGPNTSTQKESGESLSSGAMVKKHNRRNTEPIQSGSSRPLSATNTTTLSWGSMFDFSSIFFSTKKSKPHRGRKDRRASGNQLSYDINISSPSTASYSGDDDYDSNSSASESFNERIHPVAKQTLSVDSLAYSDSSNSPSSFIQPDHRSSQSDEYDALMNRNVVASPTDDIAERWISMAATAAFSEPLTPSHTPNQNYYCCSKRNVNRKSPSPVLHDNDYYYYDSGDQSPHRHYRILTDRNPCSEEVHDDVIEVVAMSTPRDYTNEYRNFQYGTQNNSASQNVRTAEMHVIWCSNHPSTIEHPTRTNNNISREEYTTGASGTQESTSSRDQGKLNHQESYSSVKPDTGRSPQKGATLSGNNMSDDEVDDYNRNSSDDGDDDNHESDVEDDAEEEEKLRVEATFWKTAVDPKSGRTYYYNTKTLETQWRKPLCCASPSERRAAIKKEKQTLAFFASMEANILCSMQQQQDRNVTGSTTSQQQRHHSMIDTSRRKTNDDGHQQHRRESEPPSSFERQQNPFKLIRTISSMEDSVLAALVQRVPSFRLTATKSSKNQTLGNGSVFSSYARPLHYDTSITTDTNVIADGTSSDVNDNLNGTVQRLTVREDSLPFGALMDAAARSQRRMNGLDMKKDGSSFNFSALMRMNSQKVQSSRFDVFDHIPEGDNEDNSENCSNQFELSETTTSPSRGNKSLMRQSGFMNLNKSECFALTSDDMDENLDDDEADDEDIIEDPMSKATFRDSLRRMNGSLALQVELPRNVKEPITREDSLNMSEIAGGRSMKRDPSVALHDGEQWGSYLSETALLGLSADEGEAMLELASITDRMGDIHSDTSDASDHSVDDVKITAENVEPRFNTSTSKWNAVNTSSDLGWNDTPELFASKPLRQERNEASRPSMIRPTSLRHTATVNAVEAVTVMSNAIKPSISRRNTCGTLYVGSTLSAPDKDATIKCVCAVYRAHILQSTMENDGLDDKYKVFDDMSSKTDEVQQSVLILPTLDDVTVFYRDVFSRAQMESDCIIISLIYVERLIKVTDGALRPRLSNWRSILFSCMVMASKVWDDLSMWNADFSHTCPAGVEFKLSRINELEIAVLSALEYKVKVPASEYAKYYFLLRSMLIKSGLGSDDLKAINPLDVEGAKQLQHISSQYQASVAMMSDRQKVAMGRSKTTGGTHVITASFSIDGSTYSDSSNSSTPLTSPSSEKQRSKVGLEHMVQL